MTEERQSGGGSVYFVYFICFFQGTLQMEGEKKDQRNFFYLPFIFQAHGRISVVAMCKAKNGALKKRKGLRWKESLIKVLSVFFLFFLVICRDWSCLYNGRFVSLSLKIPFVQRTHIFTSTGFCREADKVVVKPLWAHSTMSYSGFIHMILQPHTCRQMGFHFKKEAFLLLFPIWLFLSDPYSLWLVVMHSASLYPTFSWGELWHAGVHQEERCQQVSSLWEFRCSDNSNLSGQH